MRVATPSACAVLTLALAAGATPAQPGGHRFDASFHQADRNKDGFLDAAELARAFRGPSAKVIDDKVGAKETHPDHAFVDAWDANKDGKISLAEFERYESAALASARTAANRGRTYTRGGRAGYRAPRSRRPGLRDEPLLGGASLPAARLSATALGLLEPASLRGLHAGRPRRLPRRAHPPRAPRPAVADRQFGAVTHNQERAGRHQRSPALPSPKLETP